MRISDWSSDVCSSDLKDSFVANRVTTLKLGAFFSVGGARVTTLKTAVWADDVTHGVRATTLRFGVYADDHTHGVRATTLSVGGWARLDQGLYLQSNDIAPLGSNEVFTPSITSTYEHVIPPAPKLEVTPFHDLDMVTSHPPRPADRGEYISGRRAQGRPATKPS